MLKTFPIRHRANLSRQAGFTLVELLVVIGIIAVLAGVALGPITNGIKKAKQSTGMQTAHVIAIAEFAFSDDHDNSYPDRSNPSGNTGTGALAVALPLITGHYITDPSIFYISGSEATRYTGTSPTTDLSGSNISWDFCGSSNGGGVNANFPDACPVLWSSVSPAFAGGGSEPSLSTATAGTPVIATPGALDAFGTDGMAIGYKGNNSKFVPSAGSPKKVTMVDTTNPGVPSAATVLAGG